MSAAAMQTWSPPASRCVFDGRTDRYLPPSQVPAPELVVWLARVHGDCCVKVMAINEREAQQEATKEFGAKLSNPARHFESLARLTEKFQTWLAQGSPVERSHWDHAPELLPLDVLLKALGHTPEPAPAPPAAQAA